MQAIASSSADLLRDLLGDADVVRAVETDDQYIILACSLDTMEMAEILIDNTDLDPGTNESLPFRMACWKGDLDLVHRLLKDERVNPMADDSSGLLYACESKHHDIVELILNCPRFEIQKGDVRALQFAMQQSDSIICALFIIDGRILKFIDARSTPLGWSESIWNMLAMDSHVDAINALLINDKYPRLNIRRLAEYYQQASTSGHHLLATRLLMERNLYSRIHGSMDGYERFIQEIQFSPEARRLLLIGGRLDDGDAMRLVFDEVGRADIDLLRYCLRHGLYLDQLGNFMWGMAIDHRYASITNDMTRFLDTRLLIVPRLSRPSLILALAMFHAGIYIEWSVIRFIPFVNSMRPIDFIAFSAGAM